MLLRPGSRLQSVTCETQVIVVRAPGDEVDLRCGGKPMVAAGEAGETSTPAGGFDGGTLMGKRYASEEIGLEVLCTKAGAGSLSVGEQPLLEKDAKPLPASD
jgi:hypothetical protein